MAKRFLGIFSVILIMCVAFVGCPTEDNKPTDEGTTIANNNTGGGSSSSSNDSSSASSSSSDDSSSQSSSGSGNENQGTQQQGGGQGGVTIPDSNRITSLQAVIGDASNGDVIDLSQSQYKSITNYSARVSKSLSIRGSGTSLRNATITVESDNVQMDGLSEGSVVASRSLSNGSLRISSSSLSSLKIYGGGINSIVLEDCSVDVVEVNKDMNAEGAEFVRLDCSGDNNVIADLSVDSSVFIEGNITVLTISLKNGVNISTVGGSSLRGDNNVVITFVDEINADNKVRLITKKNSFLDGNLLKAVFTKKYPNTVLDDKIINAVCNNERFYSQDESVKLFDTKTKTITLKLRIEDLSTDVGAVHAQYWVNKNMQTNWVNDDNGLAEAKTDNNGNRYAEITIDDYPYGVDFTFKLIFLDETDSYIGLNPNSASWDDDVLPIMQPSDLSDDYKARAEYVMSDGKTLVGAQCALSTCMILGDGVKDGLNFDLAEDASDDWQSIRCTFAEHNIFGDCTITINKDTFPEIYFAEGGSESQPIFPINCGRLGPIRPQVNDHRHCFTVRSDE